ncbi:CoA-binding protein [Terrihabitans soli]|uniref:CoA-binding protein n=1 Tax=Terrihabitans soli TaxID=708113 RepID=A0A6S6QUV9_9HYPH|nr:CoA-binding protein [Terrihabitans soli]BCJ90881.1 CoA-binding protein [Terrihabitans soli]
MAIDGLQDSDIRNIFEKVRTIALVGASNNPERPSNYVGAFLQQHGYRVIPVNPGLAGQEVNGEKVYAALADIPEKIDMVDIFRAADAVPGIVDEALKLSTKPQVIWMQMGIINQEAADTAKKAGLTVVMDRCPKVEIPRLQAKTPA